MKIFYWLPLLLYLQLSPSTTEFDTFINEFSPKEYKMVQKFHQLPDRFKRIMNDLQKLKFVSPLDYNSTDFNNKLLVNNGRRREAIYFAYSDNSAIVYYMHGGRAAHEHVYIVGIDVNQKIWHKNILPSRHRNLAGLQQILKNKDYSEAYIEDL